MFEAKFKLRHRGCWSEGLARFKSSFTTRITASLAKNFSQDIIEVSLVGNESRKIKEYFKCIKLIEKFEILQESDSKMLIQLFTDTSDIKSIVYTILNSRCFLSNKVRLFGGCEIWTIAAPSKTMIKDAVAKLERFGEFKLLYIRKSTFDGFNLSSSQEKILRMALSSGFYEWPRRASLQDMAKRIGISKATAAEHLRKAQAKVISKEFA